MASARRERLNNALSNLNNMLVSNYQASPYYSADEDEETTKQNARYYYQAQHFDEFAEAQERELRSLSKMVGDLKTGGAGKYDYAYGLTYKRLTDQINKAKESAKTWSEQMGKYTSSAARMQAWNNSTNANYSKIQEALNGYKSYWDQFTPKQGSIKVQKGATDADIRNAYTTAAEQNWFDYHMTSTYEPQYNGRGNLVRGIDTKVSLDKTIDRLEKQGNTREAQWLRDHDTDYMTESELATALAKAKEAQQSEDASRKKGLSDYVTGANKYSDPITNLFTGLFAKRRDDAQIEYEDSADVRKYSEGLQRFYERKINTDKALETALHDYRRASEQDKNNSAFQAQNGFLPLPSDTKPQKDMEDARKRIQQLGYNPDTYIKAYEKKTNREAVQEAYDAASTTKTGAVLGSALSTLSAPMRGLGGVVSAVGKLAGKEIDPDDSAFLLNNVSTAIRQGVQDGYTSEWFGGASVDVLGKDYNVGNFLYNTIMSGLDSAVNMYVASGVLGALGAGGVATEQVRERTANLTSLLMSSEVYTDELINAKRNGWSDAKAITWAATKGVIEAATEKYSIEAILNPSAGVFRQLGKAFLAEGSEEVTGNILETVADVVYNGDKSEIMSNYYRARNNGASESKAAMQALGGFMLDNAEAFLSGGLSGMAMGATGTGAQLYNDSRTGKNITVKGVTDDVLQTAVRLNLDDNADLAKRIAQAQARQRAEKSAGNIRIGQIARLGAEQASKQEAQAAVETMTQQLVEQGLSETSAAAAAEAYVKHITGQELTKADKKTLRNMETEQQDAQQTRAHASELNEVLTDAERAFKKAVVRQMGGSVEGKSTQTISDAMATAARDYDGTVTQKMMHVVQNSLIADSQARTTTQEAITRANMEQMLGTGSEAVQKLQQKQASARDAYDTLAQNIYQGRAAEKAQAKQKLEDRRTVETIAAAVNKTGVSDQSIRVLSAGKGKLTLQLADGTRVSTTSKSIGEQKTNLNPGERAILTTAAQLRSAEDANAMIYYAQYADEPVAFASQYLSVYNRAARGDAKAGVRAENAGLSQRAFEAAYASGQTKSQDVIRVGGLKMEGRAGIGNYSPRAGKRGGVTDLTSAKGKQEYVKRGGSRMQIDMTIDVLRDRGKKYGIDYVLVDSIGGNNGNDKKTHANGHYDGDHTIYIAMNGDSPLLTAASHETYHYFKQQNRASAMKLQNYIIDALQDDSVMGAEAYAKMHARLADAYKDLTAKLSEREREDYIREEIAANSVFDVFSNEKTIRALHKSDPGLFGALKARITDFISDLKRHMERAFGGGSESYTAPVARALSENIERMETIRRMFDEIGEEVAEQVREPGRRAFADALRGQLDRRVQATAADEAAKWDKDHSYVPFSEVKAVETAIKFSRISAEQDAAYLAAVERGDIETTDSMVRSAAKEWGAASDERGRVVDLYHGTSEMGFTVFETNRTKSSEGLIYTTTKSNVAANYGGRNNYAGVRMIGRKFIENATKTGDIIQNAETILNRKFKVASQPDRQKVIDHVTADAQRLSDRFNDLYDDGSVSAFLSVEGASELYDRRLCHIDFVLGAIANPDDYYDPEYATAEEYRREAKEAYEAYKETRRFIDEHREDIVRAGGKPVADFYQSFDVGDTLVDIEYRYTKAIDNDHEVVISNGRDWFSTRIDYPADLQRVMEETHKIGSYHLFGNLGSKPLIVDGGNTTDWLSVPVPDEINVVHGWTTDDGTKYSSTDQIAKTAKAAGYTAVVIKNVYDGGDMADDYIFFDSSQLKSADPVTYDDAGNVIPLSERFNEEKKDIRFSLAGTRSETADKSMLQLAEDMEKQARTSEEIRQTTGWFRGLDGKWRYEVDDSTASLVENPDFDLHYTSDGDVYRTARLKDILSKAKLLEAYPELGDITVIIQQTDLGVQGTFFPTDRQIVLTQSLFERYTKEYNDYLNGGRKQEIAKIEKTPEYREYSKFFDDEELSEGLSPEEWLRQEKEAHDKFFNSELGKRYYQLKWGKVDIRKFEPGWSKEAKAVLFHELQHAVQEIEGFAKGGSSRSSDYDRMAGEIEARDTANRLNLTAEERRAKRPDIDRKDVVFKWSRQAEEARAESEQIDAELDELAPKINGLKQSETYNTLVNRVTSGDDGALDEYVDWINSSGLNDMVKRQTELERRREELRRQAAQLQEDEDARAERDAIEKSGKTEAEYFRGQAVKEFGYTPYFYDAGYMTPDGKLLNFSGEKGQHFGERGEDHRAIGIVFETSSGTDAMIRFMNYGNIRVMAETPGIDLYTGVEPTAAQYAKIRQMVREYRDEQFFNVDLSDENGNSAGALSYEGNVNADRVVNDIKHFFATGEVREQSDVERFRYSFKSTKTGMANDALQPYDDELRSLIERNGGVIVDSYDKLVEQVNRAFDKPTDKTTLYFGILDPTVLDAIQSKVPNMPKAFDGHLFKPGRSYSVAATLDSIRHLVEDKPSLKRADVIDFLDRLADTIVENDTTEYSTDVHTGDRGLLFKKAFSDGVVESFDIVSNRKRSIALKTIYLERASYEKKKSASTPLNQKLQHTSETKGGQTSTDRLPHPGEEVKGRSSRIAADSAFAYTATAKENEGLRKTVASLSRALEKTRLQLNAAKRETVQTRSGGITDRFDARARNQLYTLAGRYIREADSTMDQKELSDRLEMVLQSVFNTEYGHLGDDTMNALADIGYDMLRQKKRHRTTDTRSEFKREARRVTYYINPEEQKNLADHYGSWKNFREAARAHGVTYTTNKTYARNGKAALGIGELLQMSESNGDGYDIDHSILFDWSDGTFDVDMSGAVPDAVDFFEALFGFMDGTMSGSAGMTEEDVYADEYDWWLGEQKKELARAADAGDQYRVEEIEAELYGGVRAAEATDFAVRVLSDALEYVDLPTFADVKASELKAAQNALGTEKKAHAKTRQSMEKEAERLNSELKSAREAMRQTTAKMAEAAQQAKTEQAEAVAEARKTGRLQERQRIENRDSKRALRKKIRDNVKRLDARLRAPKDAAFIPDALRGVVRAFVDEFLNDTSVFDRKTLATIAADYARLNSDEEEGVVYDAQVATWLDELRDDLPALAETFGEIEPTERNKYSKLTRMNLEQLQKVSDIAEHFAFIISQSNKIFFAGRSEQRHVVCRPDMDRFRKKGVKLRRGFGATDAADRTRSGVKSYMVKEMIPIYFFERLGGNAQQIWYDVENGQAEWGLAARRAAIWWDELTGRHKDSASWWKDKKENRLNVTLDSGENITLTRDEIMALYATYKREETSGFKTNHILGGGIRITHKIDVVQDGKKGSVRNAEPYKLTQGDLTKILGFLTDEQKAFADEAVGYLSGELADRANETSRAISGYSKFLEPYYFPFKSDPALRGRSVDEEQNKAQAALIKNKGFTVSTTANANSPLLLGSFTDIWESHVSDILMYTHMAIPQTAMAQWFNYKVRDVNANTGEKENAKTMRAALDNAYGKEYTDYIDTLLRDMSGSVTSDGAVDLLEKGLSSFKKMAVFANMSVVIQQPSAYLRAMAEVNPKYFAALPKTFRTKSQWKEMMQYSGVTVLKDIGGFDMNNGRGLNGYITDKDGLRQKLDDFMGAGAEIADKVTWVYMWQAVKKETAAKTGLKGEELLQAAGKRFDYVMEKTQVYDSKINKSAFMRSQNTLAKIATSFMAEPTKSFNMLMQGVYKMNDAETKADKTAGMKLLARSVTAFVAASVLNELLQSIIGAMRDKDEDRTLWEKYLANFSENMLTDLWIPSMLPYFRDVTSIMQGYDATRSDLSPVTALYDAIEQTAKAASGSGDWQKALISDANILGILTGIPAKNLSRLYTSFINLTKNTAYNVPEGQTNLRIRATLNEALDNFLPTFLRDYIGESFENYGAVVDAFVDGNDDLAEQQKDEIRAYLAIRGKPDAEEQNKRINTKLKAEAKSRVLNGTIDDKDAIRILEDELGVKKGYEQLLEWKNGSESKWASLVPYATNFMHGDYKAYMEGVQTLISNGMESDQAVKKIGEIVDKVKAAAQAKVDGDEDAYDDLVAELTENYLYSPSQLEKDIASFTHLTKSQPKEESTGTGYKTGYTYDDLGEAYIIGDTARYNMIRDDMKKTGRTDKTIDGYLTSQIKAAYNAGQIDRSRAEAYLKSKGFTGADLTLEMRKWDGKGDTYDTIKSVVAPYIEKGGSLAEVQKEVEFLINEVKKDKSDVIRALAGVYKPKYVAAVNSGDSTTAANIKSRFIAVAVLLGYTESYENNYINKNWK